jgi:hypothetical protein
MDDLMPADILENDQDVEVLRADQTVPAQKKSQVTSIWRSEETDDVDDIDDAHSQSRYRRGYRGLSSAEILGEGKTKFQIWQEGQSLHGENEWVPFQNQKEWDLAQWLIRNVGQKSTDEFLKLHLASICTHIQSRFTNLFSDSRPCQSIFP